jgi:hypothetical protein
MKTSNQPSYDKISNLSVTGNYVDAYSIDGRAILINHRSEYNSVWLNFNQENLYSTIRITTSNDATVDFTFQTKYLANGTLNNDVKSNTKILPIQHKNIQLINNPLYYYNNNNTICNLYYAAGLTVSGGDPFKMLAYPEEDSGGVPICTQLYFNGRDPGDCDSDGVLGAGHDFPGYWITFENGTC